MADKKPKTSSKFHNLPSKLQVGLDVLKKNNDVLDNKAKLEILNRIYSVKDNAPILIELDPQKQLQRKGKQLFFFPVISSNVTAAGWDPNTQTMYILFHGNGEPNRLYAYRGASVSTLKELVAGLKKYELGGAGTYVNDVIKKMNLRYVRMN